MVRTYPQLPMKSSWNVFTMFIVVALLGIAVALFAQNCASRNRWLEDHVGAPLN